jgi:hypothetical protein
MPFCHSELLFIMLRALCLSVLRRSDAVKLGKYSGEVETIRVAAKLSDMVDGQMASLSVELDDKWQSEDLTEAEYTIAPFLNRMGVFLWTAIDLGTRQAPHKYNKRSIECKQIRSPTVVRLLPDGMASDRGI